MLSCWRSGAKLRPIRPPASTTFGPVACGKGWNWIARRAAVAASHADSSRYSRPGGRGFVDRAHAVLLPHRKAAGFILVGNRIPARNPAGRDLIILRDRGAWQVVEQGLKPVVEERQPMFDALMFAARADRLV